MKKFLIWTLALSIGITGLSSCSRDNDNPGKDGINGRDGINGKDGNTIHSGQGEPPATLGKMGDYYLAEDTKQLYGPKSDKGWGTPQSLGKNGADGKDGSQILKGNTPPNDQTQANVGDWYIDIVNKKIYYKNANGWEEIFSIGNNTPPTTLKGDYILSKDGTTLYTWLNKELNSIDMQADPELSKVTTIGAYAFANDSILSQITLPSGLKKIGNNAFENSGLTSIIIPKGVTSIDRNSFRNNQLTSITLSNGVVNIGSNAFSENKLTSIIIPNSIKNIGFSAFLDNPLISVRIEATTPPITTFLKKDIYYRNPVWGGFKYNDNLTTISVPQQSVEAYKQAEGWKEYADKIQGY